MLTLLFTFYKTSYLNEEVNRTDPSFTISVPWLKLQPNKDDRSIWLKKPLAHFNFYNEGFQDKSLFWLG